MIFTPTVGVNGSFNARGGVINNVGNPVNLYEAVSKSFLEQFYPTQICFQELKSQVDKLTVVVNSLLILKPNLLQLNASGTSWDASGLIVINIGKAKKVLALGLNRPCKSFKIHFLRVFQE